MMRCFKVSKGHSNSFSACWESKEQLGWGGLIIDLSRRIAQRNHYLPSEGLKNHFVFVDEAMFHDVVKPIERIFSILCIEKSDLDEEAEVMF
jgi:hypothetical protein